LAAGSARPSRRAPGPLVAAHLLAPGEASNLEPSSRRNSLPCAGLGGLRFTVTGAQAAEQLRPAVVVVDAKFELLPENAEALEEERRLEEALQAPTSPQEQAGVAWVVEKLATASPRP